MALIKQFDKRSGITYVYENYPYWDKVTKTHRAHRKLVGRYNPETGEITPTDGRCRNRATAEITPEAALRETYDKLLQQHESDLILIQTLQKEITPLRKKVDRLMREVQNLTEERDIAIDKSGDRYLETIHHLRNTIDILTAQQHDDLQTIANLKKELACVKSAK